MLIWKNLFIKKIFNIYTSKQVDFVLWQLNAVSFSDVYCQSPRWLPSLRLFKSTGRRLDAWAYIAARLVCDLHHPCTGIVRPMQTSGWSQYGDSFQIPFDNVLELVEIQGQRLIASLEKHARVGVRRRTVEQLALQSQKPKASLHCRSADWLVRILWLRLEPQMVTHTLSFN